MSTDFLVGDVGGTNIRLALYNNKKGNIKNIKFFLTSNFKNLETVINIYLKNNNKIKHGCIAIACPINNDWVKMTNNNWAFSINKLKINLKFKTLKIINDFIAISMSIPMLNKKDLIKFGGKKSIKKKPIVVYGAGTGLGVAHLIYINKQWISLPGEGGHVDFAPNSKEELLILDILRSEIGHVSMERILSGKGLINLYKTIMKINNKKIKKLNPEDISKKAIFNKCIYCKKTLSLFCTIMGRFGGNLALTLNTFGGVYIAGGIVPKFLNFFKSSDFRIAFEDKGRFKNYIKNIPVYMIINKQPGLLGAGFYLNQILKFN
ncbi:Glucokinase [Candidatus Annandia adelgestsuga]|uniref:Glucokinase n=1 Tax=Candidatus Annandia adelgestsuga TaxID=1302411 RepID=A0A3Q9CKT9_9ENTR|nr:glucokinase [Candidatus Annandia adelgestsuga]AZP36313.1 Glucokinase [Candidatus Annandia adelgestsuga]